MQHDVFPSKVRPDLLRLHDLWFDHFESQISAGSWGDTRRKAQFQESHCQDRIESIFELGFLKRICCDFRKVKAITSIYNAHVRSHLEYAFVIWNPIYGVHSDKIESVQKQFVIYALRGSVRRDAVYILPPYSVRCSTLGLESLARRRSNSCIFFVYDVLSKAIDAPQLYDVFNSIINVPLHSYGLRMMNVFRNVFHRTQNTHKQVLE